MDSIKRNVKGQYCHTIDRGPVFACKCCGADISAKKKYRGRNPAYCGIRCYAKALTKLKTCPVCTKQYPSDPNTAYCSVACYKSVSRSSKGKPLSEAWKAALSEGRKNSAKCKGPNLYNWKGGKETSQERVRLSAQKRRSHQRLPIPAEFLKNLIVAQSNKCFYCEKDLTDYKAIEHLTPLSRGGDNQKYNIVYSCKSCNSTKRTRTMEEYAIGTGNFHWIDKFDIVYPKALYGVS